MFKNNFIEAGQFFSHTPHGSALSLSTQERILFKVHASPFSAISLVMAYPFSAWLFKI
jgi:hypothetical protein